MVRFAAVCSLTFIDRAFMHGVYFLWKRDIPVAITARDSFVYQANPILFGERVWTFPYPHPWVAPYKFYDRGRPTTDMLVAPLAFVIGA